MREKGINSFQYVLLGSCLVSNKDEQTMFEQEFITRLKPTLNEIRAHTTHEQRKLRQQVHHSQNKDKINKKHREHYARNKEHHNARVRAYRATRKEVFKEYRKQHHIHNLEKNKRISKVWRERTKEVRTCVCGSTYNFGKKSTRDRHYRTEKHTKHVNLIKAKLRGEM